MPTTALETDVRREKSLQRWVKRIFWIFIALLIVAAAIGAIYEATAEHRDRQRFAQVGRSVSLGAFSLNINCTGSGKRTVILESGLGIPAVGWQLVQPRIAQFARVCSYDRAGYGWSDPGPFPRTSREIALELHALLQKDRIAPPYILVGHSFGGFTVRLFNQLYPAEVSGAVLVDSSHEDQVQSMGPEMREAIAKDLRQLRRMQSVMGFLIDFGIARSFARMNRDASPLPADLQDEMTYLQLSRKYTDAIVSEESSFEESAAEVRGSPGFGDKPLIVLTAGAPLADPGVSQQETDSFFAVWVGELQPRLARLSTRGRQIVLLNSHHLIPFEQPQAIVDAVQDVIGQAKVR